MYSLTRRSFLLPLISVAVVLGAQGSAQAEKEFQKNCATLSPPGHYPDYESLPKYSIERRDHDTSTPPVLMMQISVSPEALGGAALIRLGCHLASEFSKEAAIYALIFDDRKASRNLSIGYTDQANYGIYLWHLRGRYTLNRQTNQQFVEVLIPEVKDGLLSLDRVKYWLSGGPF